MTKNLKKSNISEGDYKILQQVASNHSFPLVDLMAVYSLESDSGYDQNMNKGPHQGPFQFDKRTANDYNLKNRFDLKESAEAHIRLIRDRRGDLNYFLNKENLSGRELSKLSESTLNFLLHNQGAKGVANLVKTIKTGSYQDNRDFMLSNMSKEQKEYFTRTDVSVSEATKFFISSIDKNLNFTRDHSLKDIERRKGLSQRQKDIQSFRPDETVIDSVIKMEDVKRPLY